MLEEFDKEGKRLKENSFYTSQSEKRKSFMYLARVKRALVSADKEFISSVVDMMKKASNVNEFKILYQNEKSTKTSYNMSFGEAMNRIVKTGKIKK